MTDHELDVIDELHFVQSFEYLLAHTTMNEATLKQTLASLARKEYVKVLRTVDEEATDIDFEANYPSFFYLATKKGLLAYHTTGE